MDDDTAPIEKKKKGRKKKGGPSPESWFERDLTAAAEAGELAPAFEVEATLAWIGEVLRGSAKRSPVLTGAPGVGKTALFHELIRRSVGGRGVPLLGTHRVVQISIRGMAARYKDEGEAYRKAEAFFNGLVTLDPPVVPLIRDIHEVYLRDWEPILARYLESVPHPVLAEGDAQTLTNMLGYWPSLSSLLVPIPVDEPDPARTRRIVAGWSAWQAAESRVTVTDDAQRMAVELTARFMGDRRFPRKALDLLQQTRDLGPVVTASEVVRRFGQLSRVPPRLVDLEQRLDLDEVHDFFGGHLLGQEEAVEAIVRMIALIKAGLTNLSRPFGVMMFVGPTGVGKTHAARLLAEFLFGDAQRMVRLNMADFASEEGVSTLFGVPNHGNPAVRQGLLTQRLHGHPFGVLLLDELEKAHTKVHDAFLQLVDEGRFINGAGELVSVTSLIIIATSNAGVEVYREAGLGFRPPQALEEMDAELDRRLLQTFRFEFLNRFDRVVHFHPLARPAIRAIAERELERLGAREGLGMRGLEVEVDVDVLDWLVAHGYHPHYGARFLNREIERSVASVLAEFVVRTNPPSGSRVALGVRRNHVQARLEAAPTAADPPRVRNHDVGALEARAGDWLDRWDRLEKEHGARVVERSALIAESAAEGFWDDADKAQATMRRYKELDAQVEAEQRMLADAQRLRALMKSEEEPDPDVLAELVEQVAANYRRWLDLGQDDGPGGAWLLIGPASTRAASDAWLRQLALMYRAWLTSRGHTVEVVAEQVEGGELRRVVLEVEGRGVRALLEMEQGEHRRVLPEGSQDRAQVDVVPRPDHATGVLPQGVALRDARHGAGLLVDKVRTQMRVVSTRRGLDLVFQGADRETLALLGRDLHDFLGAPGGGAEPARIYGGPGGVVRDPRTSAVVPRVKDALRGQLEVLLRAWESRT